MSAVASAQASVGFTGALVRVCDAVYRLVVLHLLWLAGVLVGGVVLGVGPATAAVYLVAAPSEGELSARRTAREFVAAYRRGFTRANLAALALGALVGVVVAATALLPHLSGPAVILVRAALLGALVVGAVTALGLGPALVRFGNPTLRTGFLYGIARLPLTFVSALALAAVGLAILQVPGLLLAIGPATVAALAVRLDAATTR